MNYWGTVVNVDQKLYFYNGSIDYSAYSPTIINSSHSYPYINNINSVNFPQSFIETTSGTYNICQSGGSLILYAPQGTGLTYNWLYNGSSFGYTNPSYNASINGSYQVTVSNESGCSLTSSPALVNNLNLPNPSITTTDSAGCNGETLTINVSTFGSTYSWYKNGNVLSSQTTSVCNITESGDYYLVNSTNGCVLTSNHIYMTISTPPNVSISTEGMPVSCQGDSVKIVSGANQPNLTYKWYFIIT